MKTKIEGSLIEDTYRVDNQFGGGAFGKLYRGIDVSNNRSLAIKTEDKDCEAPQLPLEYRFYILLGSHSGLPKVYHFGPCGIYHVLVMDLLGPSLEKMFDLCGKRFSVETTARIALQLIDIFQYIHSKRIVFRDVKPDNFLLGIEGSERSNSVHVIDFGLAKEFMSRDGRHIPMRNRKNLIGTPRYMSVWCHTGTEQSRRDDLLSVGYMLVYFVKSRLPWQGFQLKGRDRYNKIGKVKVETEVEQLCAGIPTSFAQYLSYVKSLDFEAEPDYKLLSSYFEPLVGDHHGHIYDWERIPASEIARK